MNLIGLDANQLDVAKEGLAGILIFYIILDVGSHLSMYALGESLRRILSISGIFLAISFVLLLIYVQLFDKSTAQSTFAVIWIGSLAASLFASWKLYHRMLEHSSLILDRESDVVKIANRQSEEMLKPLKDELLAVQKTMQRNTNMINLLAECLISNDDSLKKFKELYSNDHEEKDIQKFLATNTWILGDEYVYQQPEFFAQFPMWKDKLDFFVKRYDGFYDIIEIKKADAKLFVGLTDSTDLYSPTRESPMADDLKNAISQLMNYLEEANIFRQAIHEINKNITIHKPRGFIVIGRNDTKYDKAITTINDYLSGIQILTYDQLYQKAMGFVTRIKKGHV